MSRDMMHVGVYERPIPTLSQQIVDAILRKPTVSIVLLHTLLALMLVSHSLAPRMASHLPLLRKRLPHPRFALAARTARYPVPRKQLPLVPPPPHPNLHPILHRHPLPPDAIPLLRPHPPLCARSGMVRPLTLCLRASGEGDREVQVQLEGAGPEAGADGVERRRRQRRRHRAL